MWFSSSMSFTFSAIQSVPRSLRGRCKTLLKGQRRLRQETRSLCLYKDPNLQRGQDRLVNGEQSRQEPKFEHMLGEDWLSQDRPSCRTILWIEAGERQGFKRPSLQTGMVARQRLCCLIEAQGLSKGWAYTGEGRRRQTAGGDELWHSSQHNSDVENTADVNEVRQDALSYITQLKRLSERIYCARRIRMAKITISLQRRNLIILDGRHSHCLMKDFMLLAAAMAQQCMP